MTQYIKADAITYAFGSNDRLLIHVCNDKGVMGSGIALQVKNRCPSAFHEYRKEHHLGSVTFSHKGDVSNLVAQHGYGSGRKFLNYGALAECLKKIRDVIDCDDKTSEIVLPLNMGAARAGGSWDVVIELVEWYFKDYSITVCEFEEKDL